MRVNLTSPFSMNQQPQQLNQSFVIGPLPDARWRYQNNPRSLKGLRGTPASEMFQTGGIPSWYSNAVAQAASSGYSIPVLVQGNGSVLHVNPDGTWAYTIGGAIPGPNWNDPIAPSDSSFVSPPLATWNAMITALGIPAYVANYGPSGVTTASQAAAAVATAPANMATYFSNPANSTSVAPTGAAPGVSLAFITSRGGTVLQPGDTWTIKISGATPNIQVSASGIKSGQSLGTTSFGSTDANGNFTLSGSIDSTMLGSWAETWYVGSQTAGQLSFSVVAQGSAPAPIVGSGGPVVNVTGTATPQSSLTSLISGNVGGIPTSYLLIGGGALVLILLMGSRR